MPMMEVASEFDVLVVGGGIIGLTVAEACASRGLRVAVYDAAAELLPASAAKSGALVPAMGRRKDRLLGIMQRESLALYSEWCSRLASLSRMTIPLRKLAVVRYNGGHETMPPFAQLQIWPPQASIPDGSSYAFASLGSGMEVDTSMLMKSLRHAFLMQGGRLFNERVVTAVQSGEMVISTLDSGATRLSRYLIACTGRYLSLLFPVSSFSDDSSSDCIVPDWGQMIKVYPRSDLAAIVLVDGFTLVPKCNGAVWVTGAHREGVETAMADAEVTQQMLSAAEKIFNERLRLEDVWAGIRPRRRGGIPLIAQMRENHRIIAAVGHSSNGFLLAPLTARQVLKLLVELM